MWADAAAQAAQSAAQASTTSSVAAWGSLASVLTSGGFAAWVAWYMLTRWAPRQQRQHEDSLVKQASAFAAQQKVVTDIYAVNSAAERASFERIMSLSAAHDKRAIEEISEGVKALLANQGRLERVILDSRGANVRSET